MKKVSCICPTYGRPGWLEESIESFHRQTYKGPKEIIILNDHPDQELIYNHPEVKIYNKKTKFKTLGQKYNYMFFSLSDGDIVTPWEDDDIFLPHKIERAVGIMQEEKADYYKLGRAYFWNYGKITEISENLFYCAGFYTRELLNLSAGCSPDANAAADQTIESKLRFLARKYILDKSKNAEDIYYIYRWGGIGTHISGISNQVNSLDIFQADNKHNERKGQIELKPHWKTDYIELCRSYRESIKI